MSVLDGSIIQLHCGWRGPSGNGFKQLHILLAAVQYGGRRRVVSPRSAQRPDGGPRAAGAGTPSAACGR
jgi:hypothetical protein